MCVKIVTSEMSSLLAQWCLSKKMVVNAKGSGLSVLRLLVCSVLLPVLLAIQWKAKCLWQLSIRNKNQSIGVKATIYLRMLSIYLIRRYRYAFIHARRRIETGCCRNR